MLSEKITTMLNKQIQKELASAYLYLQIASYYEGNGLKGFANWFKIQAKEEQDHAEIFYNFLHTNGAEVVFYPVEPSDIVFTDFIEPLNESLDHEKFITASIHQIYVSAKQEDCYRTMEFLNWFIKEQLEEEENAQDLISKMELFGDCSAGLYEMDKEYGKREYKRSSLLEK